MWKYRENGIFGPGWSLRRIRYIAITEMQPCCHYWQIFLMLWTIFYIFKLESGSLKNKWGFKTGTEEWSGSGPPKKTANTTVPSGIHTPSFYVDGGHTVCALKNKLCFCSIYSSYFLSHRRHLFPNALIGSISESNGGYRYQFHSTVACMVRGKV